MKEGYEPSFEELGLTKEELESMKLSPEEEKISEDIRKYNDASRKEGRVNRVGGGPDLIPDPTIKPTLKSILETKLRLKSDALEGKMSASPYIPATEEGRKELEDEVNKIREKLDELKKGEK